jgi:hypothetical protein
VFLRTILLSFTNLTTLRIINVVDRPVGALDTSFKRDAKGSNGAIDDINNSNVVRLVKSNYFYTYSITQLENTFSHTRALLFLIYSSR